MENKKKTNKMAAPIYYLAIFIAFASFLLGLKYLTDSEVIVGLAWWGTGIVATILLSGFGNIIELLDNINNKLDNISKKQEE